MDGKLDIEIDLLGLNVEHVASELLKRRWTFGLSYPLDNEMFLYRRTQVM